MNRSGLLLVPLLLLAGCGHGAAGAKSPAETEQLVSVVKVEERDLGEAVVRLLEQPSGPNRLGALAGVVGCELSRAERLFDAGQQKAAEATLAGAFFLVGRGEYRREMIRDHQALLLTAANAAAHDGSEARAQALYSMLDEILPAGATHDDVKAHLQALALWQKNVTDRGGLQALGAAQRASIAAVLYRPDTASYGRAKDATLRWMDAARRFAIERNAPETAAAQDEREEAMTARQNGVAALIALALRTGDHSGLLETLDDPAIRPNLLPRVGELLQRAIEDSDPEAWATLLSEFDSVGDADSELAELARAASFRIAIDLYRAEAHSLRATIPLAGLLTSHGMADGVPKLLERSLSRSEGKTDPREVGVALRLVLQAMLGLEAIEDVQTARLTFANSKSLIQLAAQTPGEAQSAVATLEHTMGAMEVRAGELTLARPHLAQAVHLEANPEALRLLAAIDLQQGRGVDAMQSLKQIIAQSANEPLSLAESQLLRHDLLRDLRNVSPRNPNAAADASGALAAALQSVLTARSQASSANGQAGIERVLSRVLENYGDNAAARRASERAMDAATADPSQLVSVILDAVRRALTAGDLQSARTATRRALDEDLSGRDIAYAGLWLTLLEQQLKATPDGTAREVLTRTARGDDWPAKLSNWALGKLSDAALQASAKSKIQGVEATFYLAMAARARGDKQAAIAGLRRVAAGEAVELFEVTIARDLLSQYDGWTKPALPPNIEIP